MLSSVYAQSSRNDPVHNASRRAPPRVARSTVLHLTPDLDVGSNGREVVDLAIHTHRSGWRPLVASAGGSLVIEAERAAVRHTRMPLDKQHVFARWRSRLQLEALFQHERPSLVHAHGIEVLPHALGLNTIHRLPVLVDIAQPVPTTRHLQKLLHTAQQRQAWFRVPSAYMAKHLREDLKLSSDRLCHIPPGIDLSWFDASRVSSGRLQKISEAWRLPEQATIIVMATPLSPGYGHRQLLEALRRLQINDIFTVLVGDDKLTPGTRADIERQVIEFGLEGRVVMPDHCADWPAACWLATLVVATNTLPTGQAMSLLAAQAMGRPVIVTDCGANAEMVKSGETAWVIPPDDIDVLTQVLNEAVHMNESQRIDLAQRTRSFVGDHFPLDRWSLSLTDLYGAMLGRTQQTVDAV
jgi:glycosyltransferase involved in cell wall biosynthesis